MGTRPSSPWKRTEVLEVRYLVYFAIFKNYKANLVISKYLISLLREKVWVPSEASEAAAKSIPTSIPPLPEEARMSDGSNKRWNDPEAPSNMYLVLPSYTEPQKTAIKKLIAEEKQKRCSIKLFKQLFANTDFKIAFSNSNNSSFWGSKWV